MDVLIHFACLLRLYSCFQRDLLRLRLLTLVAALCVIVYFATLTEPMLTVIGWNAFFLLVNLTQVSVTLARRHRGARRRTEPRTTPRPMPAQLRLRSLRERLLGPGKAVAG
jgi:hypothetical protein